MGNCSNIDDACDSNDFMLAEYQTHQEEFKRSEDLGENRLTILLTIVTAVLGGSGIALFFSGTNPQDTIDKNLGILLFAYTATLMFGGFSLVRMIQRNMVSDKEKRATARIRRYFVERNPRISRYLTYGIYDDMGRTRNWKQIKSSGSGGLVETVMLINALLGAIIGCIIMRLWEEWEPKDALPALTEEIMRLWEKWGPKDALPALTEEIMRLWEKWGPKDALPALRYVLIIIFIISFLWAYQFRYVKRKYDREMDKAIKESRFPMIGRLTDSVEMEAPLIILSDDPQLIAEKIEGLTSIGSYLLLPQFPQYIHDRYFDTTNGDLSSRKIALRIREVDGINLITLKGPSIHYEQGNVAARREIETNWSKESMDNIIKELQHQYIKVGWSPSYFINRDPAEIMSECGLEVIQDRQTRRTIRNIVSKKDKSGPVLAELAIDYVVFYFSGQKIKYHDIEIEAKSEDGLKTINDIQRLLLRKYPSKILPWKHSKLVMGMAIHKLIQEDDYKNLIDDKGNLKPCAYKKIDDYIKKQWSPS